MGVIEGISARRAHRKHGVRTLP